MFTEGGASESASSLTNQVARCVEVPGQTGQIVGILPGLCYSDSEEDSDGSSSDSADLDTDVFQQKSKLLQMQHQHSEHRT